MLKPRVPPESSFVTPLITIFAGAGWKFVEIVGFKTLSGDSLQFLDNPLPTIFVPKKFVVMENPLVPVSKLSQASAWITYSGTGLGATSVACLAATAVDSN